MSKIVFLNMAEGRTLELKIDGESTWMDVADEFVYFLQGSGYRVSRVDIANHFTDSLPAVQSYFDENQSYDENPFTSGHDDVFQENNFGEINLGDMVSTFNTVDKKWL